MRSLGSIGLREFWNRLALCERSRKTEHRPEGWNQISGFQSTVKNHSLANTGTKSHHPGSAGECVPGPMMLKSVAAGIIIRITSKIRQDKQSGIAGVFRLALNRFP